MYGVVFCGWRTGWYLYFVNSRQQQIFICSIIYIFIIANGRNVSKNSLRDNQYVIAFYNVQSSLATEVDPNSWHIEHRANILDGQIFEQYWKHSSGTNAQGYLYPTVYLHLIFYTQHRCFLDHTTNFEEPSWNSSLSKYYWILANQWMKHCISQSMNSGWAIFSWSFDFMAIIKLKKVRPIDIWMSDSIKNRSFRKYS